ncbi:MAG: tetratricopeptide repeat protein [Streptosporangiaceae bacterium]
MQQPRDFSMYGAIDLGARQAAVKRRQQAAQSQAGGGSEFVIDVTDASFTTDVVTRSQTVPVVIDLWAEWCGPCKQLSPVLERLAEEAAGDWILAKVDVDANPQLGAALQVQSIPMVLAAVGGQLLQLFMGALPEPQVRQYIGEVLRVAEEMGLPPRAGGPAAAGEGAGEAVPAGPDGQPGTPAQPGAPGAGPSMAGAPDDVLADPRLRAVQEAVTAGDLDSAAQSLEQVLAASPGHPVAKAWLAQVELFRRVSSYDPAKVRQEADERPDDPEAQARAADVEFATGQIDASFDRMLAAVAGSTGADRDRARKHLLGLFDIMPPGDPAVARARTRLSSLLF